MTAQPLVHPEPVTSRAVSTPATDVPQQPSNLPAGEATAPAASTCKHCGLLIVRWKDPWAERIENRSPVYLHADLVDADCNGIACPDGRHTLAEPGKYIAPEWYEASDHHICAPCYLTINFKSLYSPMESPVPDVNEDMACECCSAHPCLFCGHGIVPLGEKYCQEHADFCVRCNGSGELGGDANYEEQETCPDCGGKGRR